MAALPLVELYDALRAAGFAIGVDDHVRIAQLLAYDGAWAPDTLRIAIAALVVTDPSERAVFDACWERWLRSVEAPQAGDVLAPPRFDRYKPKRWRLAIACALAIAVTVVLSLSRSNPSAPRTPKDDGEAPPPTTVPETPQGPAPQPLPLPESPPAIDLTYAGFALGGLILAAAAVAALLGARARRRFLPGPWRYVLAVPAAHKPVLARIAIEDAAAGLTGHAHAPSTELDVTRSAAATARAGGFPTLVFRRRTHAPLYAVLQDTAGGANRWQFVYDELLRGLAREGIALERYTFAASPASCTGGDGRAVTLDEVLDHADGVIVIGDGATALDPLRRERALWLDTLSQLPDALWINPLPPARWSAGAHAIAEHMAMAHGAVGAIATLCDRSAPRERPANAYPAVIERAPGTASAASALRVALGERAFLLVAAVAVTGPPTIASMRWLAEAHALDLHEHDWLAVATLPWFRSEQWPVGLRERLQAALFAEAPRLARAVAISSERVFAASEPPRHSGAHLVWQLDGALRASQRGDHTTAARELNRIARTPLAHVARDQLHKLRLGDRERRAFVAALIVGVALLAGASASLVVKQPETDAILPVATATRLAPQDGARSSASTPDAGESPEPVLTPAGVPHVYVHVGPIFSKTGDATLSALMATVATRELTRRRDIVTSWPGGTPSKAALDAQQLVGFDVEGTLTELTVTKTSAQPTVACKISLLLATYPEKTVLGMLTGGATVQATSKTTDLAPEREDCVAAVIEDLIVTKILPEIAAKTGLPDIASGRPDVASTLPAPQGEPAPQPRPTTSTERAPEADGHPAQATAANRRTEADPKKDAPSPRPARAPKTPAPPPAGASLRGRTVAVPTVTIGQPPPPGGDLDKAIIRRYIKRYSTQIQYCYDKQRRTNPTLSGTVNVQFFITPNGTVTQSTASGVDSVVSDCIAAVIKDIEFPKVMGDGGVVVNYPFTFHPPGREGSDREGPIDRPDLPAGPQ